MSYYILSMKHTFLFLFILLALNSCKEQGSITEGLTSKNYTLVADDLDIQVEQFDSTIIDVNKYNVNNQVFKVGTEFLYNYKHIDTLGELYSFKIDPSDGISWRYTAFKDVDSNTIKNVKISVLDGNPWPTRRPDYNQTVIQYEMEGWNGKSKTGVIENEANTWMHPPRQSYFRILELNPFPYIKAPYEIGTTWDWSLNIGAGWGDERWKTWQGSITNTYNYEITGYQTIDTPLGALECHVVKGKASSSIGDTYLKAYFNETYGFVILDYTNIDRSKTKLELVEHYSPEN